MLLVLAATAHALCDPGSCRFDAGCAPPPKRCRGRAWTPYAFRAATCPPFATAPAKAVAPGAYAFYNVYARPGNASAARGIAREQIAGLIASPLGASLKGLFFATIGDVTIRDAVHDACAGTRFWCRHLGHAATGFEEVTLAPLREFCEANPRASVAYLHDKGSFHPLTRGRDRNGPLRRFLLRGLSSRECAAAVDEGACDVCSARFSPMPHQHTPGNMWLARCDYVARLLPPCEFARRMEAFKDAHVPPTCRYVLTQPYTIGLDRFATEHWVHAHPAVRPCDTTDQIRYFSGYQVPAPDLPLSLAAAPRYSPQQYRAVRVGVQPRLCKRSYTEHHAREWAFLYGEQPPAASRLLRFYVNASLP